MASIEINFLKIILVKKNKASSYFARIWQEFCKMVTIVHLALSETFMIVLFETIRLMFKWRFNKVKPLELASTTYSLESYCTAKIHFTVIG